MCAQALGPQADGRTHTHTHTHTDALTHSRHSQTQTQMHTCTFTHQCTQSHTQSHTHTHSYTHGTVPNTLTQTQMHTCPFTHQRTHTVTHTHSHTQSHPHCRVGPGLPFTRPPLGTDQKLTLSHAPPTPLHCARGPSSGFGRILKNSFKKSKKTPSFPLREPRYAPSQNITHKTLGT